MAYASYNIRRRAWCLWEWEADYHRELSARGCALSEAAARRCARSWLRDMRRRDTREAEDAATAPVRPAEETQHEIRTPGGKASIN
jgi:hypothetical protein